MESLTARTFLGRWPCVDTFDVRAYAADICPNHWYFEKRKQVFLKHADVFGKDIGAWRGGLLTKARE